MRPEDKLLGVIEGFIATYGGWRRLREIKILLLIQKAAGHQTINPTTLAKLSGMPLETVRRVLLAEEEAGNLILAEDPNDSRSKIAILTEASRGSWNSRLVFESLTALFTAPDHRPAPTPQVDYDLLLFVIDTLMEGYMDSIRIRGAKMSLLVQRATIEDAGISISDLARLNDAPFETVRRILAQHVEMGHIQFTQDPNDDRKTLVVSADLELEANRVEGINKRIEARMARRRSAGYFSDSE